MALSSMTGFGAGTAQDGGEAIAVELRSVNGKFCEVKARLPRELASLELEIARRVKARIARGNVDVAVRRDGGGSAALAARVNAALLQSYAEALRAAARDAGLEESLGIRDLLGLDGVTSLEERPPDLEAAGRAVQAALEQALDALVTVRRREGSSLEEDLRARTATLRQLVREAERLVPASVDTYRERLRGRLAELAPGLEVDSGRLEQEVVIFAERTDVAEELTRLSTHLEELERLLGESAPAGRRMEFLLQEINREANTLGSKSQATALARVVVEMKVELERLREQSQNVE